MSRPRSRRWYGALGSSIHWTCSIEVPVQGWGFPLRLQFRSNVSSRVWPGPQAITPCVMTHSLGHILRFRRRFRRHDSKWHRFLIERVVKEEAKRPSMEANNSLIRSTACTLDPITENRVKSEQHRYQMHESNRWCFVLSSRPESSKRK